MVETWTHGKDNTNGIDLYSWYKTTRGPSVAQMWELQKKIVKVFFFFFQVPGFLHVSLIYKVK